MVILEFNNHIIDNSFRNYIFESSSFYKQYDNVFICIISISNSKIIEKYINDLDNLYYDTSVTTINSFALNRLMSNFNDVPDILLRLMDHGNTTKLIKVGIKR